MKTRLTSETSTTTTVTIHGNERLLKGLLARLSFVAISFPQKVTSEAYTPRQIGRNRGGCRVLSPTNYTRYRVKCFIYAELTRPINGQRVYSGETRRGGRTSVSANEGR